jgi:hypothetical protein
LYKQIRLAIIKSSIQSITESLPAELLFQLMKNGIWRTSALLSHIQQLQSNTEQYAQALRRTAALFPDNLRPELLRLIQRIHDHEYLSGLVEYLPAELKVDTLLYGLDIVRAQKERESFWRSLDIYSFLIQMPDNLLDKALSIASEIQDERLLTDMLNELATRLPDNLLDKALSIAQGIKDDFARSEALVAVGERLSNHQRINVLSDLLQIAQKTTNKSLRAYILSQSPRLGYKKTEHYSIRLLKLHAAYRIKWINLITLV